MHEWMDGRTEDHTTQGEVEMTIEEVQDRIAEIANAAVRADNETAHLLEDDLFMSVLGAIAGGAPNGRELADAALKALNLGYARWYA